MPIERRGLLLAAGLRSWPRSGGPSTAISSSERTCGCSCRRRARPRSDWCWRRSARVRRPACCWSRSTAGSGGGGRDLARPGRGPARQSRVPLGGERRKQPRGDPRSLLAYRYLLSPTLDRARFDESFLRAEFAERLRDMASPAAAFLEPWLPRDPTLELLKLAESWQPERQPQTLFDVWFDTTGSQALLVAETRAPGFDPQGQRAAADALQGAFARVRAQPGLALEVSGPGAFSLLMKDRTQVEAQRLGVLATVGMVLLLLVAYRSVPVLVLGLLPLVSAGLAGLAAVAQPSARCTESRSHSGSPSSGSPRTTRCTSSATSTAASIHGKMPARCGRRSPPESPAPASRTLRSCFRASGTRAAVRLHRRGARRRRPDDALPAAAAAARTRRRRRFGLLARLWAGIAGLPRPTWLGVRWRCLRRRPGVVAAPAVAGRAGRPDSRAACPDRARLDAAARAGRARCEVPAGHPGRTRKACSRGRPRSTRNSTRWCPRILGGFDHAARYLPTVDPAAPPCERCRAPALQASLGCAPCTTPFRPDVFAPFLDDVERARRLPPLGPPTLRARRSKHVSAACCSSATVTGPASSR